jgi:nitrate reductase NapAB chaperone NapD
MVLIVTAESLRNLPGVLALQLEFYGIGYQTDSYREVRLTGECDFPVS